mmetsp:Transcript_93917/g.167063  ORF Transcript_93917/g.167063 Transcript_93917/m.167063 type:complete len:227 (+) Transcript_93917:99-779(+)
MLGFCLQLCCTRTISSLHLSVCGHRIQRRALPLVCNLRTLSSCCSYWCSACRTRLQCLQSALPRHIPSSSCRCCWSIRSLLVYPQDLHIPVGMALQASLVADWGLYSRRSKLLCLVPPRMDVCSESHKKRQGGPPCSLSHSAARMPCLLRQVLGRRAPVAGSQSALVHQGIPSDADIEGRHRPKSGLGRSQVHIATDHRPSHTLPLGCTDPHIRSPGLSIRKWQAR